MGFANYCNYLIKNFARIVEPITCLLGSKTEFVWGTEQDSAFHALQVALTLAPELALPDWCKVMAHINPPKLCCTKANLWKPLWKTYGKPMENPPS